MKRTITLIFFILLTILFFIACSDAKQNTEQTELIEQELVLEEEPTPTPTPSPSIQPEIIDNEETVNNNDIGWEEFVSLYDGNMPDFTSLSTFTLCESFPESQGGYRMGAYFKQIEEGDFDRFIDFATDNGYEFVLTIKSEYIMDNTLFPLTTKIFKSNSYNTNLQISYMQGGIEQIVIEYHANEVE